MKMNPFFEHKATILQSRREDTFFHFPLHMHLCPEFLFINHGELQLNYPDQSFLLKKGDFAVIFPNTIHGYTTLTGTTDYSIAICRQETAGEFAKLLFEMHPATPIIRAVELPGDIPALMDELISLNGNEEKSTLIKAIIGLILARIMPLLSLKPNTEKFKANLTVRAVTYVYEHFKEEISLDTAAASLGISRFAVSRLFNAQVQINFVKYVRFLRINYAKELLTGTDMNIVDISLESGFDCLRSFNRVFKEETGMTPLKYRKNSA